MDKKLAALLDRQWRESQGDPEPAPPKVANPDQVADILARHHEAFTARKRAEGRAGGTTLAPYPGELNDQQLGYLFTLQDAPPQLQDQGVPIDVDLFDSTRTLDQVRAEADGFSGALRARDMEREIEAVRARYEADGVRIRGYVHDPSEGMVEVGIKVPDPR